MEPERLKKLKEQADKILASRNDAKLPSYEEMLHAINDLQVYQIELEVQNEELQRTHEELSRSRDAFQHLFNFAPVAYAVITEHGIIQKVNQTFHSLLGLDHNLYTGTPLLNLIADDFKPLFLHHLSNLASKKETLDNIQKNTNEQRTFNLGLVKLDKKIIYVKVECRCDPLLTGYDVKTDRLKKFLMTLTPIDDLIQTQELLKTEKTNAEQAAKVKSDFLSKMSHEIRTPLNAIIGMTDLALEAETLQEVQNNLHIIRNSGKHLLSIVNDILDLSKIEGDALSIDKSRINLKSLLSEASASFHPLAKSKNLELRSFIDESIPDFLFGDGRRISQIFLNLLNNAIKFTEKGFVKTEAKLENLENKTALIKILVSDSGPGIADSETNKIFDRFYQVKQDKAFRSAGTGLGLAISKSLVETMGGSININSTVGEGSTFYFTLPLLIAESLAELKEEKTLNKKEKSYRILVAEDNTINGKLITKILQKLGHTTKLAENGEEAGRFLAMENFDLIILDIEMPVKNGFETIHEIKSGKFGSKIANTPIIAMTAYVEEDIRLKCIELGFSDFVTKPINIYNIEKIIQNHISQN